MNTPLAKKVDYAILGGGGAGLSMLCHLYWAGALDGKEVLIVDPQIKTAHDRTWSFWERGTGPFESVVYHQWSSIGVHNHQDSQKHILEPLKYKVILSKDFYHFCNKLIDQLPNVNRIIGKASSVKATHESVHFTINNELYQSDWAFSSVPKNIDHQKIKQPYLDQHFRGWFIRTPKDCFDPDHATIMDFRTNQCGETRFLYVLPLTPNEALVEVAIFSNTHLDTTAYDTIIADYLDEHWPEAQNYKVYHTEQGVIPMTTYPYPLKQGRLLHIGLGGGWARPSTGYTFYNIQKQCAAIARSLVTSSNIPEQSAWPYRHLLYDGTLLSILASNKIPGALLFPNLFAANPTVRVLDFLNGETNMLEELKLMHTTNISVFGKAFIQQLLS